MLLRYEAASLRKAHYLGMSDKAIKETQVPGRFTLAQLALALSSIVHSIKCLILVCPYSKVFSIHINKT